MTKHLPCIPIWHLQYFCFVFVLGLAQFNWVDSADRDGPACQSGLVQEPCAEMQQNLLDVLGTVDEDHGRGTLFQSCGRWPEDRWSCSELPTWACGYPCWCNNRSNKCEDGSRTFLWPNGSAVPVDVLVNPINPAHGLVVFDHEWLAISTLFPSSRPWFDFLDWV